MHSEPNPNEMMSALPRREVLTAAGAGAAALLASQAFGQAGRSFGVMPKVTDKGFKDGRYILPSLPYRADALEPMLDSETVEIHHRRHHQGYVNGMNTALAELEAIREGEGDASLTGYWAKKLTFAGSGHINHMIYWMGMAPNGRGGGGEPTGELATQIAKDFGSFEKFAAQFKSTAQQVEGSGWGWLVWEPIGRRLLCVQMESQQKLLPTACVPLLGVDVWEHAYYLKYQNKRGEYLDAFMDLINWQFVQQQFTDATT
ncbi:MAG: superoxide dismutase [Planctomycetota bacterium]